MSLVILAVIFFVLLHVSRYFTWKYDRMNDCSPIANLVQEYWRSARSLPDVFLGGMLLCVWFLVEHIEFAKMFAAVILFFCAFSFMCLMVMGVCKTFECLFAVVNFDRIRYRFERLREEYAGWRREFKEDRADMLLAAFLNTVIIMTYVTLMWNMARSVFQS